jgi:hypothetical protein
MMFRTVILLAIGMFLGRQASLNYDREEARIKENERSIRLIRFLKDQGFNKQEAEHKAKQLLD